MQKDNIASNSAMIFVFWLESGLDLLTGRFAESAPTAKAATIKHIKTFIGCCCRQLSQVNNAQKKISTVITCPRARPAEICPIVQNATYYLRPLIGMDWLLFGNSVKLAAQVLKIVRGSEQ